MSERGDTGDYWVLQWYNLCETNRLALLIVSGRVQKKKEFLSCVYAYKRLCVRKIHVVPVVVAFTCAEEYHRPTKRSMRVGGGQAMGCWCDAISPNLKIAVNIKNLPVNPGYRFNKIFFNRSSQQKIPRFIWCVLAFCVVIFLIQCDFSDCSYAHPCFQP